MVTTPERPVTSRCGEACCKWLAYVTDRAAITLTRATTVLSLATMILLGACKGNDDHRRDHASPGAASAAQSLTVFAAASLRDVFTELAVEFRRRQPTVAVTFHFAGTQELRAQLEHGAKADVLAAADVEHAAALATAGLTGPWRVFAYNEPVLVVSKEARASVTTFQGLRDVKRVVLGASEVPIGRYSALILENAAKAWGADFATQVRANVVSRELNVKQVLAKVALGEADAGIVYRTDVAAQIADQLGVVTIPDEVNEVARYAVAAVTGGEQPELAEAWITTLVSDAGKALFTAAGFAIPAATNTAL